MAATVKKEGIRKRRFPQSSTKHALSTPYNLQWPGLKNQNQMIIDQIVRTLEPLHFKQLCTRMPKASAEDNEEAATRILEEQKERAKKLEQRSNLELGLNQVTRALEKGTLKLVLVDRSIKPSTLLEHLLVLCATRRTPACAVSGLGESTIPVLLGLRSAAALGFKNTDTPTVFDELVDFIKERIPPLYVPWLHPSKETSGQFAGANPFSDEANGSDSDDEHLPGIEKLHGKQKRKRIKKRKENTGKMNTQSVTTSVAINTGQLKESIGNTGLLVGNTGMPVQNTGTPNTNTGTPTVSVEKPGKLKLSRAELLEVFGTTNSAPSLSTDTSKNENKEKKKRRRRFKKKQEKKVIEPPVKLVYLRPCIKSFDPTPKDKGNQIK